MLLRTETKVIVSLSADRAINQGKDSRTRKPSVSMSKRPSGQPVTFLPTHASTANDRPAREAPSGFPGERLEPALSAMKQR